MMSPITQHLRALCVRRNHLDEYLARSGYDRFRAYERAALAWTLEKFHTLHPKELAEAEQLADEVRAKRKARLEREGVFR